MTFIQSTVRLMAAPNWFVNPSSVLVGGLVFVLSCSMSFAGPNEPQPSTYSLVRFEEVGEKLGIRFKHRDGRSGARFYIETAASGAGWFDYDGDGDQDLYLLNGARTPGSPAFPNPMNRLFENRKGTFHDVTGASGLGDEGYGMGMCVGDVDGDGLLDVFVTNFGPDRLFRNLGSGRFEEIGVKAGVSGDRWGSGCAFGDVDGDGDLDLFVANYVNFSFEQNPTCVSPTSKLASYCRPDVFDGNPDYLYINQGNGRFREEGKQRGIVQALTEKGFGVAMTDIDNDGDLDIVVGNDGSMNRLYINDGKGKFEDQALLSGLGFNGNGQAEASMGLEIADIDGNGLMDVLFTHYDGETNTFYLQREPLFFEDATRVSGLGQSTLDMVGWGVAFLDADNDGDLDAAVANGHVLDNIAKIDPGKSYSQLNQLFINQGKGRFKLHRDNQRGPWTYAGVSRGMARADFDNDGRIDLIVNNTNGRPHLLKNQGSAKAGWLGVHLVGPATNRAAIGARIRLFKGQRLLGMREVRSGGSFMSQHDLRVHFGLGNDTTNLRMIVRWPDQREVEVPVSSTSRYLTLRYQENSP